MTEIVDESSGFKDKLITLFKESAMKAFLFRATRTYSTFNLESLVKIFELKQEHLIKTLS
jgi:hypothetical protein